MSTPAPSVPKPCPHCGVDPVIKSSNVDLGHEDVWFVGCSNELDCPVWPLTFLHPSATEAVDAWNAGATH